MICETSATALVLAFSYLQQQQRQPRRGRCDTEATQEHPVLAGIEEGKGRRRRFIRCRKSTTAVIVVKSKLVQQKCDSRGEEELMKRWANKLLIVH